MAATIVPPPNDTAAVSPSAPCPNCGSSMVDAFCARCGEQQPSHRDLAIRTVALNAAQEFAGIDGKVPRTLWALITKPGLLTREFIDGRRSRYSKPLSLFLVLNLVFFLIQPHTGLLRYSLDDYIDGDGDGDVARMAMVRAQVTATHESHTDYTRRFNDTLADQKRSMLLFAVPVFAATMALLYAGSKRYFVEHVVFAVHTYAFLLVLLTIGVTIIFYTIGGWVMIAGLAGAHTNRIGRLLNGEAPLVTVIIVASTTYIALAIRRAYGGTLRAAAGRALVLSFMQMLLVTLYHDLLFYTAFYAT